MTKGYTTNAGVFAKRGDPWVSDKEGSRDFGRNLDSENPDLDALLFARFVQPKPEFVDPPKPEVKENSFTRRKTNILLRYRRMQREGHTPDEASENPFDRF